jgi:hypothetical protein
MQQQTGIPFMHIMIVQPGIIMLVMQSQQACIILTAIASPLVHIMVQPMSINSTLVMPMVMLQQQHIMPFIMQQQLIMALGIIMHKFCIMVADILSSHMQVTFIPLAIFSNCMVQRGIIMGFIIPMPMFMPLGMPIPGPIGICMPIVPIPIIDPRSVVVMFIVCSV